MIPVQVPPGNKPNFFCPEPRGQNGITLVEDTSITLDIAYYSLIILKACFPHKRAISKHPEHHIPNFVCKPANMSQYYCNL